MFVRVWLVIFDVLIDPLVNANKGIKLSAKCWSTGAFELISTNNFSDVLHLACDQRDLDLLQYS